MTAWFLTQVQYLHCSVTMANRPKSVLGWIYLLFLPADYAAQNVFDIYALRASARALQAAINAREL